MIRFAASAAALVLAVSCSATPKERDIADVREAFDAWADANARGDVEGSYGGMTVGMLSHWIWQLFQAEDPTIMKSRAGLEGTIRTDLDLWLGFHQKHKKGDRAEPLPASVLQSAWPHDIYTAVFALQKASVQRMFTRMRILDVYVDNAGATVVTKIGDGRTQLYAMVLVGDRWMVDGHRSALRRASQ